MFFVSGLSILYCSSVFSNVYLDNHLKMCLKMYKLEHEMQQNKRFRDDERNCYTDPEVNKNE